MRHCQNVTKCPLDFRDRADLSAEAARAAAVSELNRTQRAVIKRHAVLQPQARRHGRR